jgi:hypothetical protein
MKKILIGNIILSIELEPLYIDDIQTTFVLNLSQIIRRLTFFIPSLTTRLIHSVFRDIGCSTD